MRGESFSERGVVCEGVHERSSAWSVRQRLVNWETKEPTKEQTTKSEEPVEHGGWSERLVWPDEQ